MASVEAHTTFLGACLTYILIVQETDLFVSFDID